MGAKLAIADAAIARLDAVVGPRRAHDPDAAARYEEDIPAAPSAFDAALDRLARASETAAARAAIDKVARRPFHVLVWLDGGWGVVPRTLARLRGRVARATLVGQGQHRLRDRRPTLARALGAGVPIELRPFRGAPDFCPESSLDLVLARNILAMAPRPAELLSALWSRLRPGGVLALLAEPRRPASLDAYAQWLTRRLSDQLSADDAISLHRRADPYLRDLASHDTPAWCAAHPSAAGVDVPTAMARIDPAIRPLFRRRFGSLHFLACAPYPFVGPRALATDDGWESSVWIKPA